MIKLFSDRQADSLDQFNFFIIPNDPFCLIFRKASVDLKRQTGLLGKSLIINRQFDRVANYCMEIKCPNARFLEMHVLA